MKLAALTKAKRTMNHTVYWATNLRWCLKNAGSGISLQGSFLRFYIIYMPVVWISHVFHWYLWPCPLTARKFAKVTYDQRSLWRHLRSRKLTANRGLSQEEKNDRNEAKTYWFSKPVSFNVECARPVKTARWKFLSSQLLFAHTRSVSCVARD